MYIFEIEMCYGAMRLARKEKMLQHKRLKFYWIVLQSAFEYHSVLEALLINVSILFFVCLTSCFCFFLLSINQGATSLLFCSRAHSFFLSFPVSSLTFSAPGSTPHLVPWAVRLDSFHNTQVLQSLPRAAWTKRVLSFFSQIPLHLPPLPLLRR